MCFMMSSVDRLQQYHAVSSFCTLGCVCVCVCGGGGDVRGGGGFTRYPLMNNNDGCFK